MHLMCLIKQEIVPSTNTFHNSSGGTSVTVAMQVREEHINRYRSTITAHTKRVENTKSRLRSANVSANSRLSSYVTSGPVLGLLSRFVREVHAGGVPQFRLS